MRYASRVVLSSLLVRDTVTDGTKHGCRDDRDHHDNRCLLRYRSTTRVTWRDNIQVSLRSTMVQSRGPGRAPAGVHAVRRGRHTWFPCPLDYRHRVPYGGMVSSAPRRLAPRVPNENNKER